MHNSFSDQMCFTSVRNCYEKSMILKWKHLALAVGFHVCAQLPQFYTFRITFEWICCCTQTIPKYKRVRNKASSTMATEEERERERR